MGEFTINVHRKHLFMKKATEDGASVLSLIAVVRRKNKDLIISEFSINLCIDYAKGENCMPIIKSISSLRNRTREIAAICHDQDEPVYLTTNGEGDLVVMSIDHYERLKAQVDLFEKLAVAQAQSAAGKKGITHKQMMTKLRRRINAR